MKKHSLSQKFVVILLAACSALALLSFIGIQTIYLVSNQVLFQKTLESAFPIRQAVSKEFEETEHLTYQFLADQQIQSCLNTANWAVSRDDYTYYKVALATQKRLGELLLQRPAYIDSAGIVDLECRTVVYGKGLSLATQAEIQRIIQGQLTSDGQPQWFVLSSGEQKQLLCLRTCRKLDNFDLSLNGYLFCILSAPALLRETLGSDLFASQDLLLSLNGEIFYNNLPLEPQRLESVLPYSAENCYKLLSVGNQQFFFSLLGENEFGLGYVSAQNVTQLTRAVAVTRLTLFSIIGLIAFLTVAIALKQVRHISKRIKCLTQIVGRTYDDNFRINVQELTDHSNDEISQLAAQYLTLTQRIDKLVNEVLTRKLLFKESQIRMLQSQINPHFIYNTLDTVNALASCQRTSEISQVVASLANLMHYSLDDNMLSYVDEEVRIAQQYLSIQKLRYQSRLEAEIFVQEDCFDIEMPKMLLQPLMENAIKYSAERKVGTSRVRLRISAHGRDLAVTVLDNGIGLDKSIREMILKRQFDRLPGHGLKNVFLRLENLLGSNLKITIRSAEGRYTAIRLVMIGQCDFRRG